MRKDRLAPTNWIIKGTLAVRSWLKPKHPDLRLQQRLSDAVKRAFRRDTGTAVGDGKNHQIILRPQIFHVGTLALLDALLEDAKSHLQTCQRRAELVRHIAQKTLLAVDGNPQSHASSGAMHM